MAHWTDAYVGQPYVPQAADCARLAVRVQRERFGRTVTLPQLASEHYRDQAAAILRYLPDYGIKTDAPEEGDAVLLRARGHDCHIGIYVFADGERQVLHAFAMGSQVSLHRLRVLERVGLKVEGFYKWK